jgi:hypothetical protein
MALFRYGSCAWRHRPQGAARRQESSAVANLLDFGIHGYAESKMRRLLCLLVFSVLMLPAAAQQPPKLEPLPAPPPPPPGVDQDSSTEQPVQITPGPNDKVEETVVNGRRTVRVTTPQGLVYYLIEDPGVGGPGRREGLDQGLRVPMWVIKEF